MANCNEQQCRQLRKKLGRSNARIKIRRHRIDIAAATIGLGTGASVTFLSVWVAKTVVVNTGITVIFPLAGIISLAITGTALLAFYILIRQYKAELQKRNDLCQQAHDVCDHECLPRYCR